MTPVVSTWPTPRRIRAYVGAAWFAAFLVFTVALQALRADRAALRAIAQTAAPNIVAAEELAAHLADLDTELANALVGSVADRGDANARFEWRRSIANRKLVDAAISIAVDDLGRDSVVVMSEELGRYFELAARARWQAQDGDRDGALSSLRLATEKMHTRILPAAAHLDAVDRAVMDGEYTRAMAVSQSFEAEAFVCGAVLVGVLVAAQVFVRRRMRRRLVPALLAATILSAAFSAYLVGRFHGARENLRVARDDAFNSVHLLWKATALAYDARGDESRWLLDRPHADEYEAAFRGKMTQLVSKPGPWHVGSADLGSGRITGLLVDEARNVTFDGEEAAVNADMQLLAAYVAIDDGIRSLERQGRHAEAVERCVGSRNDGSRAAFDRFDASVRETIAINQRAFDAASADSDRALARAEWLDPAFALAIGLLVWLGVRARLREYA